MMCAILSACLFISAFASMLSGGVFNEYICLIFASGIFAIAAGIYSMSNSVTITIKKNNFDSDDNNDIDENNKK